ncbi:MAG: hypothetical protein WA962_14665 [Ornithinimicrobium sp.]
MNAPMESWVRDILRCPVGLHPLVDDTDDQGAAVLVCDTDCGATGQRRRYRFDHGIPVLLAHEATVITRDSGTDGSAH